MENCVGFSTINNSAISRSFFVLQTLKSRRRKTFGSGVNIYINTAAKRFAPARLYIGQVLSTSFHVIIKIFYFEIFKIVN